MSDPNNPSRLFVHSTPDGDIPFTQEEVDKRLSDEAAFEQEQEEKRLAEETKNVKREVLADATSASPFYHVLRSGDVVTITDFINANSVTLPELRKLFIQLALLKSEKLVQEFGDD